MRLDRVFVAFVALILLSGAAAAQNLDDVDSNDDEAVIGEEEDLDTGPSEIVERIDFVVETRESEDIRINGNSHTIEVRFIEEDKETATIKYDGELRELEKGESVDLSGAEARIVGIERSSDTEGIVGFHIDNDSETTPEPEPEPEPEPVPEPEPSTELDLEVNPGEIEPGEPIEARITVDGEARDSFEYEWHQRGGLTEEEIGEIDEEGHTISFTANNESTSRTPVLFVGVRDEEGAAVKDIEKNLEWATDEEATNREDLERELDRTVEELNSDQREIVLPEIEEARNHLEEGNLAETEQILEDMDYRFETEEYTQRLEIIEERAQTLSDEELERIDFGERFEETKDLVERMEDAENSQEFRNAAEASQEEIMSLQKELREVSRPGNEVRQTEQEARETQEIERQEQTERPELEETREDEDNTDALPDIEEEVKAEETVEERDEPQLNEERLISQLERMDREVSNLLQRMPPELNDWTYERPEEIVDLYDQASAQIEDGNLSEAERTIEQLEEAKTETEEYRGLREAQSTHNTLERLQDHDQLEDEHREQLSQAETLLYENHSVEEASEIIEDVERSVEVAQAREFIQELLEDDEIRQLVRDVVSEVMPGF